MSNTRGQPSSGPAAGGQEYGAPSAAYQQPVGYPVSEQARYAEPSGGRGAAAGSVLAGVLMIIGGAYAFLVGLAAVVKKGFFVFHNNNYYYHWTVTGWGWTHLILGGVVLAAGVCVLLGMVWARVLGVILATLSAVASFLFIPYNPLWSITMVAVDVFIIWALVTSGRRQRA